MAERSEFRFKDVGAFIREQRNAAEMSLRKLADQAGVSNPYLSQIERGLRKPSAEILQAIAKALRISAETLYLKAGILEERDDEGEVVEAILRDAAITDRQKQALIDIYQSFRQGSGKSRSDEVETGGDEVGEGNGSLRALPAVPETDQPDQEEGSAASGL